MVLLGFGIAARCSDLAHLLAADIIPDAKGLVVTVRHGKSVGESPIPYGKHPQTCAVRAWQNWTHAIDTTADAAGGPAFRRITRHDTLTPAGLSPQAVNQALARAGHHAALPYTLTAHSLRAGFATEARRAGVPDHIIADQGRWKRGSTALHQYFRRLDSWTDNPLSQLDL
jgi:integrase